MTAQLRFHTARPSQTINLAEIELENERHTGIYSFRARLA